MTAKVCIMAPFREELAIVRFWRRRVGVKKFEGGCSKEARQRERAVKGGRKYHVCPREIHRMAESMAWP